MMKYASLMLGNSSSGIIEAASFKLPVVNIGNRQKGRICSDNVIHSDECFEGISAAVKKDLSSNFRQQISDLVNLYYKPKSSKNIIDQLLLWEPKKECSFYDLEGSWC